ncbi:MAG: YqjD family protein [Phycisphaerae bacterium]|jgi:ElaB/YqjD/DUF883 family membrane-anchored ribosome-binding protein
MANPSNSETSTFQSDAHRVAAGVDALKSDIAGIAHATADSARSGGAELRQHASEAVGQAKQKLAHAGEVVHQKLDEAKETAVDASDALKGVISRNPISSIAVAAGVGILIGLVVSRNRS